MVSSQKKKRGELHLWFKKKDSALHPIIDVQRPAVIFIQEGKRLVEHRRGKRGGKKVRPDPIFKGKIPGFHRKGGDLPVDKERKEVTRALFFTGG